ncbi:MULTISPECIES: AMIN domain-containing protein [unclassified Lebetimonas]|uniref:AMIN domain-containing protein n=2 Tax=Lebetimonas TaxID=267989 RepID=UPI00046576DD|nr:MULTISPECIES: AMIN domain-containing protein [unclassified Lebetimonas]
MRILILIIMNVLLFARINPFEPVINPQNKIIIKPEFFKEKKVYFPNDARILKKIIFVYQNSSGDIKNKEILINKNIDFHSPVVIIHKPKTFGIKEYKFDSLFTLFIKNKKLFIKTKDKLIRNMFLIRPFRLVLDFQKNADFLTMKRIIKQYFVKKIVVGNHKGFYRIVIYFDTNYSYKLTKTEEGIKIELK